MTSRNAPPLKLLRLGLLSTLVLTGLSAQSAAQEKTRLNADLRYQYTTGNHEDLGTGNRRRSFSNALDLRVRAEAMLLQDTKGMIELRAGRTTGDRGIEDENGEVIGAGAAQSFAELRQAWVEHDGLFGFKPLGLKIGRQYMGDGRSLWLSENIDALRLQFSAGEFSGFIALAQNLASYRTLDSGLDEDEEDLLRIIGEGLWQWSPGHRAGLRFIHEHDYSGTQSVGQSIKADDMDLRDGSLTWAGPHLSGAFKPAGLKNLTYRIDGMVVSGEETVLQTAATPDPTQRMVNGRAQRDVLGWAADVSTDIHLDMPLSPVITLGYAYGSGDGNPADSDDTAFRQFGLHGNLSRLPGNGGFYRHYGEVFRPELSNLHILSAGLGFDAFKGGKVNLLYHRYMLDDEAGGLRSAAITAPLNGQDSFLGQEIDMITNINLTEAFEIDTPFWNRATARLSLGGFFAGDAYDPSDDKAAYRAMLEFRVRF